jgi:glycosyltransferase involved in cell wall biosynthesis
VLEVVNGITFLTPLWCRTPRVTLIHHIHRDHYVREMGTKGRVAALALETLPLRLLYRRSRILTISQASAVDIEHVGIDPRQIEVGYLGVEHEAFGRDPSRRAERPTLLYLGRLKRYKRIEVVLDVLEQCPGAVLELAGEGDHRPVLEQEIRSRGLEDRVTMHGHVSEQQKLELYQRAWINITTSAAEGWGLSVNEAGACGTPSAALAIGGLAEAIEDGRTGVLAHDPAGLGLKVSAVLGDPALRDTLGRAAYERALGFTWDATAARTLELLCRQAGIVAGDAAPAPDEPDALAATIAEEPAIPA